VVKSHLHKRLNNKKIKVKLYLAGNRFAATAKDDFFFVDKCYADTPELAKKLALEELYNLYNSQTRGII
jgi:hypothetical protein